VGTGGAITATTPPTVAAGQAPFGITFYVANQ
jgi:hypothetical protein